MTVEPITPAPVDREARQVPTGGGASEPRACQLPWTGETRAWHPEAPRLICTCRSGPVAGCLRDVPDRRQAAFDNRDNRCVRRWSGGVAPCRHG